MAVFRTRTRSATSWCMSRSPDMIRGVRQKCRAFGVLAGRRLAVVVTVTTRRKAPGQRRWRLGGELGASMRLRLSPAVLPCCGLSGRYLHNQTSTRLTCGNPKMILTTYKSDVHPMIRMSRPAGTLLTRVAMTSSALASSISIHLIFQGLEAALDVGKRLDRGQPGLAAGAVGLVGSQTASSVAIRSPLVAPSPCRTGRSESHQGGGDRSARSVEPQSVWWMTASSHQGPPGVLVSVR